MRNLSILGGLLFCVFGLSPRPASALALTPDNVFALDFIANGDGGTGLSNLPVAVYWRWDGANGLGIRMETPSAVGFGDFWSFNLFNNNDSPGGVDSNDSNNTHTVISGGGALTATSLGAYGTPVDAIEASWTQPSFDPAQVGVYIQLTMFGPSGPSDGYRMADYLGDGGTYADAPDILPNDPSGFCATTNGTCAQLTFQTAAVPEPGTLGLVGLGLAAVALRLRRGPSA